MLLKGIIEEPRIICVNKIVDQKMDLKFIQKSFKYST